MYATAVAAFLAWLQSYGMVPASGEEALDAQVSEYIEHLRESGADRNEAGFTLSGVQFSLKKKRILGGSWQLLKVWQKLEMPSRAPPLPELALKAWVFVAMSWELFDVAVLLLLAFSGFLRTMECLTLEVWQLEVQAHHQALVIHLPHAKSGVRRGVHELVTVYDGGVALLVQLLLARLPPHGRILQRTEYMFRKVWRALLEGLRLETHGFQPYSLRRGGATTHWQRFKNLERTMELGRWSDVRTARIYLTEGLQLLHEWALPEPQRLQVTALAGALDAVVAAHGQ